MQSLKRLLQSLLLICLGYQAFHVLADIQVQELQLSSEKRLDRVNYQYTYKVLVRNEGGDATNIRADVSSNHPAINLQQAELRFDDLSAGAQGLSQNDLIFIQDRRTRFSLDLLSFSFRFDQPAGGTDQDQDGYTVEAGDCDDTNPNINPGANEIPNNGLDDDCKDGDLVIAPDFSVKINSPVSLVTLGITPIQVSGKVKGEGVALTLNGVPLELVDGEFSAEVALEEGHNTIEARGVKGNQTVTDSITVSLDQTPPYITIESHQDGQLVYEPQIIITGLINDIVRGTIEQQQANVTVNGQPASISNRSYSATITLVPGDNLIQVNGTDQVGNLGQASIHLTYQLPSGPRLVIASGQGQTGTIFSVLDESLSVRALNENNQPIAGQSVVFRVIQGAGEVGFSTDYQGRAIVAETDEDGLVSTNFLLGSRTGSNNHKVRASAVGFDNELIFSASAIGASGDKISVNSGNNQRGVVGQVLAEPLVTVVTDQGANVVAGARVKYQVLKGEGHFSTNNAKEMIKYTDSDGRATAEWVLGYLPGLDAQRVSATLLDAEPGQILTAGFVATGFIPADPGNTSISGIVLNNQDAPIPGVTIRLDDSPRQAVTDSQGLFSITQAPVGPVHLIADGSTASIPGEFPSLSYNLVTIAGVDNPLPAPIYMVKLDTQNAVLAGPEDVRVSLPEYPGFALDIAKHSVTFPNGNKEGYVSVTAVNAAKVPMPPPNGMQPQFIVTIQPTGSLFDPPARLTLPNVDGHKPGAQVEMYSYDHDLEEFVSIGLGTVSESGSTIQSNPGVGVIKAGWHCGSQPSGSGCCEKGKTCGYCERKTAGCPSGCEFVPTRPAEQQIVGNCQKELCRGSEKDDNDTPPAECGTCENGSPVIDKDKPLNADKQKPDDCKELLCGGFNPKDETVALQQKKENICKMCDNGSISNVPNSPVKSCGTTGDPKEACYTCKDGKCGNHCDASKVTNKVEYTGLSYVAEALTAFPDAIDNSPIFSASLTPFVDISGEKGEMCCKNCETPGPQDYIKFSGSAGVKGNVKATIPYLGIAHKFPKQPTSFLGFSVKGEAFITAAGASIEVNAKGQTEFLDVDCQNENCGSIFLGTDFDALIGPQVDLSVALLSCTSSQCDETKDGKKGSDFTVFAASGKGSIGLTIKGNIGAKYSSGSQCGNSCIGGILEPITGAAKGSISFEVLFKKWTLSGSTDPIEFYAGGSFGPGCGG